MDYIIKIFDRKNIEFANHVQEYLKGGIFIGTIFNVINVKDIIETFIVTNDIFKLKVALASKLLNTDKLNLIGFNDPDNIYYSQWIVHPILIKSILTHVDESIINRTDIAREIYKKGHLRSFESIENCSLLSIVENVQMPLTVRGHNYVCNGILNKDDMFNDELLTDVCIKHLIDQTLIIILPDVLTKIITSYYFIKN
jgi:hypothetical protein